MLHPVAIDLLPSADRGSLAMQVQSTCKWFELAFFDKGAMRANVFVVRIIHSHGGKDTELH